MEKVNLNLNNVPSGFQYGNTPSLDKLDKSETAKSDELKKEISSNMNSKDETSSLSENNCSDFVDDTKSVSSSTSADSEKTSSNKNKNYPEVSGNKVYFENYTLELATGESAAINADKSVSIFKNGEIVQKFDKSGNSISLNTKTSSASSASPSSQTVSAGSQLITKINELQNKNNTNLSNLNNSIANLKKSLAEVEKNLNTAYQNEDKNAQYILEQQITAINSQIALHQIQQLKEEKFKDTCSNYLTLSNNYKNNEKLSKIVYEMISLESELLDISDKKLFAMQSEDDSGIYTYEQQENQIASKIKQFTVDLAKEKAKADGRNINATELKLIPYQFDIDFRERRMLEKNMYFEYKNAGIISSKLTAMMNEDEYSLRILAQQESSIKSLEKLLEFDKLYLSKQSKNLPSYLNLLQKYPDNKEIENLINEISDLEYNMSGINSQKATAIQNNDEQGQYNLEQQENSIAAQLKDLYISLAKAEAKADGRSINDTEIKLIEYQYELEFSLNRTKEKREYLSYKSIEISQMLNEANEKGNTHDEYILMQQLNSITAMDKIFETEQDNLEKENINLPDYLGILQKYPNNSTIANAVNQLVNFQKELISVSAQKSTAMQNDDMASLKKIHTQEDTIANKMLDFEIIVQREVAKEEGKTLSSAEIAQLKNEKQSERMQDKTNDYKKCIEYHLIFINTQKATARQMNDEYAINILEQQEDYLNKLLEKSEITSLDEFYKLKEKLEKQYQETPQPTTTTTPTTTRTTTTTPTPPTTTKEEKAILLDKKGKPVNGTKGGILYKDGLPFSGTKNNIIYVDGKKFTGIYDKDNKCYKNGKLYSGTYEGILYKKGVAFNGKKGLVTYKDGKIQSGNVKGVKYDDGKILNGKDNKGILYVNGKKFSGVYSADKKLYSNGKLYNGKKSGILYKDGEIFNGIKNNILYVDGKTFTGINSADGLMYKNGKIFTGKINGVSYKKGVKT